MATGARIIAPARTPTNSAPEVYSATYTTGQTFLKGAIIVNDPSNNGQVVEGSANPAPIVGVALEAPAHHPGYSLNFDADVVARTGAVATISYAVANRITVFSARMVSGATDPVTPAISDIRAKYGLIRTANPDWAVNQADTTNVRVEIIDIDITNKIVFFRFLESAIAQP